MTKFYLFTCIGMALFLPHLAADSMDIFSKIGLQLVFILIGIAGIITFED